MVRLRSSEKTEKLFGKLRSDLLLAGIVIAVFDNCGIESRFCSYFNTINNDYRFRIEVQIDPE